MRVLLTLSEHFCGRLVPYLGDGATRPFIAALSDLDRPIKKTVAEGEKKRQDLRVNQVRLVRPAHSPLPGLRVRV
jgi:hypothetical protein